ncbi:MAG: DUF1116 domain-containing protein, partial [bacterium]|nr:DUF1116 domain-containing protein [bacterium]
MKKLFDDELKIINTGLKSFKETLDEQNIPSIHVDWRPPVGVEEKFTAIIAQNKEKIDAANQTACKKILAGKPILTGLDTALNVIPGMKKNLILHAGPPVTWPNMCGPMKGAIIGALKYEGLAKNKTEAEKLAASGEIEYAPCHEHATAGPMAGIVSASMPVFIIQNETFGNNAFCTMNEGLGKVLRYGAYSDDVIKKMKWMETVLYPVLEAAVADLGKIDLKNIIAQALHMGDEVHNRNRAATSLFYRQIAPAVIRTAANKEDMVKVLDFINGNDHFFLNLSMPACKASLDAARNVENSSVAVVMSRNGTQFGVQLSGTGNQWFTGTAPVPDALYFPGFSKEDANPDIGDSSITETNGLGGFAIAASPAIVQFVGGSTGDAINYTMQMYEITASENTMYQIPYLDFRGTPTGIDVRKVIEKNMLPFIDTGVAHKDPGVGQVGAGVLSAPVEPFKNAYIGFCKRIGATDRH